MAPAIPPSPSLPPSLRPTNRQPVGLAILDQVIADQPPPPCRLPIARPSWLVQGLWSVYSPPTPGLLPAPASHSAILYQSPPLAFASSGVPSHPPPFSLPLGLLAFPPTGPSYLLCPPTAPALHPHTHTHTTGPTNHADPVSTISPEQPVSFGLDHHTPVPSTRYLIPPDYFYRASLSRPPSIFMCHAADGLWHPLSVLEIGLLL